MRYQEIEGKYIFRIDKGEKVLESLTAWCKEKGVHAGTLSGIGAVEYASFGHYDLEKKEYFFTEYHEMLEVASMSGNIALKDGVPFLHVHGVFSGPGNAALGGHIHELTAGVVLEVVLEPLSKAIVRTYDDCIGLYLMDL